MQDKFMFMRPYNSVGTGKQIFVKPSTGNDGNSGLTIAKAVKTLVRALAIATANQHDTVYLIAESNTAASTTDYQSSTLTWNKDGVHLIGVGVADDLYIGQRTRVAFISTYDTASNLFTLSANNCFISGIEFFAGVAGTNPTGCVNVTGMRNVFKNCQISGIGNAANDISGAYSLRVAGSENLFKSCYIGLDTIIRATCEAEIRIVSGTRTIFEDCYINSYTSLTTFKAIIVTVGSYHTVTVLKNTTIISEVGRTGCVTVTGAIDHDASAGSGCVIVHNTIAFGYTNICTADNAKILVSAPIPLGKDQGAGRALDVT